MAITASHQIAAFEPPVPWSTVDGWENEGGSHLDAFVAPTARGSAAEAAADSDALATEVALMARALSTDFLNGRGGTRSGTYDHRSRVIRQLTARLAIMRESAPLSSSGG